MNKIVVVTGASKGVGKAISLAFIKEGATVIGISRSNALLMELSSLTARYAGTFYGFPCDVTSSIEVNDTFSRIFEQFERVDVLINNAGVGHFSPVHLLNEEDWDEMMNVNVKGPFLCAKAVIPHMMNYRDGHIINISSVAGLTTFVKGGGYCASKHALMAFTDVLMQELKSYGIRVSTICPGSIQTDFGGTPPKDYSLLPEDIADVAVTMVKKPNRVIINQVVMRPQIPFE